MAVVRISEAVGFRGIDNVSNPEALQPGFLSRAANCDIDDNGFLRRRKGYEQILDCDAHSLWSNGDVCFFVHGTMLKRLYDDFSTAVILNGVNPHLRMEFVDVNGVVYFTNNEIIGFIENDIAYPFPEVDQKEEPFKRRMVGGHLIEYYNGRLYSAQGSSIFYSDAMRFTTMDIRKNFILMDSYITMLKSVSNGIYVGTAGKTYFMEGASPEDFVLKQINDSRVLPNSAVAIMGEHIGKGIAVKVVVWASPEGIYLGLPGGEAKIVTPVYEVPPEIQEGIGAVLSQEYSLYLYLAKLQFIGNASLELIIQ